MALYWIKRLGGYLHAALQVQLETSWVDDSWSFLVPFSLFSIRLRLVTTVVSLTGF